MGCGFDVIIEAAAPAVLGRLRDTFGVEHVCEGPDSVRLTLVDQAAMIGALRHLHDLGIEIALVERRPGAPVGSGCGTAGGPRTSAPG